MVEFVVEYAVYDNQSIIQPDKFNRTKEFPTLKGALGFWWKKAVENRGVAHIRFTIFRPLTGNTLLRIRWSSGQQNA